MVDLNNRKINYLTYKNIAVKMMKRKIRIMGTQSWLRRGFEFKDVNV